MKWKWKPNSLFTYNIIFMYELDFCISYFVSQVLIENVERLQRLQKIQECTNKWEKENYQLKLLDWGCIALEKRQFTSISFSSCELNTKRMKDTESLKNAWLHLRKNVYDLNMIMRRSPTCCMHGPGVGFQLRMKGSLAMSKR